MSRTSTFLTEELNAYLAEKFSGEDIFLSELQREAAEAGIPAISIAPEQTSFLQVLLKSINAKRVVEIGSLAGYSAIAMARVLPSDGKLIACEINPEYCKFIRRKSRESFLDHIIEVREGPALATLESLGSLGFFDTFDLAFIDADKPNYIRYFEALFPMIRKGGLIVGDNALAWGHVHERQPDFEPNNVAAIRAFNDLIASHSGVLSTLVPLGDGMVIGLKL
jgi:caffeoyl-CoA O-methyltransferase